MTSPSTRRRETVAKKGSYLTYYMTHQEIADELGISRQMVRVIEYRALKKLKRSGKLRAFLDHINDEKEIRYGKEYTPIC